MGGASSRRKGATNERQIATWLTEASGYKWHRARLGEQPHGDVILAEDCTEKPWCDLFVEVKAHSDVNPGHLIKPTAKIQGWWDKAVQQSIAVDKDPLLCVRFKGWGWVAVGNNLPNAFGGWWPWELRNEEWCAYDLPSLLGVDR